MITPAVISTPRRLYPIANCTARIRRDPLWLAIFLAVFVGLAIRIYGDLLEPHEIAIAIGVTVAALLLGLNMQILSLDALGHPRAFIFGRTKKIRTLFRAITLARTADSSGLALGSVTPLLIPDHYRK